MTNEEIAAAIRRYLLDKNVSDELIILEEIDKAMNYVLQQNIRIGTFYDREDFSQEIKIYLIEQLITFNAEKSSFLTWLKMLIKRRIVTIKIKHNYQKRQRMFQDSLYYFDDSGVERMINIDSGIDVENMVEHTESYEKQKKIVLVLSENVLSETEKEIFLQKLSGISNTEIQQKMNMTPKQIFNFYERAIRKIKKALLM